MSGLIQGVSIMSRMRERIELLNSGEKGVIFDLSATGAAVFSRASKQKNSQINLEINEVIFRANVIYCLERTDGYRIGLQFEKLSDEITKSLEDLVDKFSRGVPLSCRIVEDIPEKV